MKDKKLIVVIIIAMLWVMMPFFLFLSFIFFGDEGNKKYNINSDGSITVNKNEIFIKKDVKSYYDSTTKKYYVEGFLTNNRKKDLDYITVDYTLYDKDNNVLGIASASINNLKSNEIWKYKATYEENDAEMVKTIKFSNIIY